MDYNHQNSTELNLIPFANSTCIKTEPESIQFYRFILNGILINIIGVLGIIGNIISMIILSRPQMRSSINYLLIGLARCDTVVIFTSILLFGLTGLHSYTGHLFIYHYVIYPYITPFIFPLAVTTHTASVYITMTVSLERFVAVCHPLRARSLCTYGRARMYVIAIIVFSIIYNLPKFLEAKIISEPYPELNMTVYCPRPSALRENETYITVYIHWMYMVFIYLIPFVSLAVLNAAIYRQVRKANQERQRLSRLQKREIGLATMLLCVVAVFFFCNLLAFIINILDAVAHITDLSLLVSISNLLITINSSVNFVIYVIFGEKFKRLFLTLFCHNVIFNAGRESPDGATHDDSFVSNGDRQSLRLHRQNTSISRNGTFRKNDYGNGRNRTLSPGPCIYYPASKTASKPCISTYHTQTSLLGPD